MRKIFFLTVFMLLFSACGKKPLKFEDVKGGWSQKGIASWYGNEFKGRPTASGEIFDPDDLTAAHKTLPLGTIVSVKNLDNGEKINLRINDRGPFVRGRIIDCSKKGAKELGFLGSGTANVRIEVVKTGKGRSGESPFVVIDDSQDKLDGSYTVQVGAFKDKDNAGRLKEKLNRQFGDSYIVKFSDFYRVRVGHFKREAEAEGIQGTLSSKGYEGFVTRND